MDGYTRCWTSAVPWVSAPRRLRVGCSVGPKNSLSQGQSSLDWISPQMLAVARVRDSEGFVSEWRHAAAEATGLEEGSIDLISLQFVCHELPQSATRAVLREAARLLRPGGVLVMVDQDPSSSVLQRLPAPVATLLKSTEPYIEDYFSLDMAAALAQAGFHDFSISACDPRHRVIACLR